MMRERATQGINVDGILAELGFSRSALEKAFRKEIRQTPLQHLHMFRCQRAMELLKDATLSQEAIAKK